MDPILLAQTVLADSHVVFDPTATLGNVRAFFVGVASLALIIIGCVALFGPGRQGNSGKVARTLGASALALIPIAVGLGIGAAAFGSAFLGWAVPGLS